MATINTQSFGALISNLVSAVQGAATAFVDFTVGSTLLAVGEAHVGIALWLQGVALQIMAVTRLATSNGPDADSFCADFGFTRLPAQGSTGPVSFARATATAQATVQAATNSGTVADPIWSGGEIVQTQDGSQPFQVIPDTTQAAYSPALNAYVLPAGTPSVNATVQALIPGSASNVSAGTINTLGSAIPGVDRVTNASAFTNGADSESDPSFKARFVLYIQSLDEGTVAAIESAIAGIQQDVSYAVFENQTVGGLAQQGYFYVVVDDGNGNPPSSFLSAVSAAIDAVRPIDSTFGVFGPTRVTAAVTVTITTAPGYAHATLTAAVQAALSAYINSLAIGADLPLTRLSQIAYSTSPGVISVNNVLLNGGTADLVASNTAVIKAAAITVS